MNKMNILTDYPDVHRERHLTELFPETRLKFVTSGDSAVATAAADFSIEDGKQYIVAFDCVNHEIVAASGVISNELFSISVSSGVMTVTYASAGAHMVGVCTCEKVYCKMPKEYLPDDVGGGADWNANEGEAGYVKNRTHYEAVETVNEPLNITWDGNTEGLVSVGDMLYKVSDLVLTEEQIKSVTFTFSANDITILGSEDYQKISDEISFVGTDAGVFFINVDNAEASGMVIPKAGIYFTKVAEDAYIESLTTTEPVEQTKTVVKKLDKKYLPDDVGGGDEVSLIFTAKYNTSTGTETVTADKTYAQVLEELGDMGSDKIKAVLHYNTDCHHAFNVQTQSDRIIFRFAQASSTKVSVYSVSFLSNDSITMTRATYSADA